MSNYAAIGVGVVTSGCRAKRTSVLGFVQSARAPIGTGRKRTVGSQRMACNVKQCLPGDDDPVDEVERLVHLPKHAIYRKGTRRRNFGTPRRLEFEVYTSQDDFLRLSVQQDYVDNIVIDLMHNDVFLRSFHTHDGHRNPDPERTEVPGPHLHFPTRKYPIAMSRREYAYPIGNGEVGDVIEAAQFFLEQLDISVEGIQYLLEFED
ncbi:MAG: hypothetical protein FJ317_05095 [SAR202 cluster bacterium]|nr:hypothetical protein [SAR202 cluster bacterium]